MNQSYYCIFFFFCLFSSVLLFPACEKSTSPIISGQVNLTAEYVAVTEVWLRVQTANISGEHPLKVWRDATLVFDGISSTADTTVYDSTLLPAHSYRYRAAIIKNGKDVVESQPLQITTMDTTSHDFQWEVIEFPSPYGSADLYDVAIVDENNIWAVGEIYADSTKSWQPYNAVHWNGIEWELKKVPFTGWCSAVEFPTIRSILTFSENDIWFARGGSVVHYDGYEFYNDCDMNGLLAGSINKMWGTNSNNIFIVGGSGTIVHYNGSSWQRIESGTELPIQDIWGVVDWKTVEEKILLVACDLFSNDGIAVLQITENLVNQIATTNLPVNISGVWSENGWEWYICGSRLYKTRILNQPWKEVTGWPSIFQQKVRGKGPNDIFVVGHFGLVLHWNGSTWRRYSLFTEGYYSGLAVTDDLVVITGTKVSGIVAGSGIILIGKRY